MSDEKVFKKKKSKIKIKFKFYILLFKKKVNSYLPEKIEWIHCKGSMPRYRGYPCSLWSLFHALTVNQVELERPKLKPCKLNFNKCKIHSV